MICSKCGNETPNGSIFCTMCGVKILNEEANNIKKNSGQEREVKSNEKVTQNDKDNKKLSENHQIIWNILSGIMFVISAIMIYIGHDKLTNYYSSTTYSSLNKNAYVGGDAYNYIINGTHATSFFVLATMSAIIAVSFIIIGYLDKISNIKEEQFIRINEK